MKIKRSFCIFLLSFLFFSFEALNVKADIEKIEIPIPDLRMRPQPWPIERPGVVIIYQNSFDQCDAMLRNCLSNANRIRNRSQRNSAIAACNEAQDPCLSAYIEVYDDVPEEEVEIFEPPVFDQP